MQLTCNFRNLQLLTRRNHGIIRSRKPTVRVARSNIRCNSIRTIGALQVSLMWNRNLLSIVQPRLSRIVRSHPVTRATRRAVNSTQHTTQARHRFPDQTITGVRTRRVNQAFSRLLRLIIQMRIGVYNRARTYTRQAQRRTLTHNNTSSNRPQRNRQGKTNTQALTSRRISTRVLRHSMRRLLNNTQRTISLISRRRLANVGQARGQNRVTNILSHEPKDSTGQRFRLINRSRNRHNLTRAK